MNNHVRDTSCYALREYNFVGSPLWRMSDRKDLVRVELTLHKNLPTTRFYKKGPKAGGSLHTLLSSGLASPLLQQKPTTRSTPASRQHMPEKETPPQAGQTLQTTAPTTIRHQRKPQRADITPSPIIMRPTTLPPSLDSSPTKKPRSSCRSTRQDTQHSTSTSRWRMNILSTRTYRQDVHATTYRVIVEATQQPREDEKINSYSDLPVFFIYYRANNHWIFMKGPTSKYGDEPWYSNIEMLKSSTGVQQTKTAYWFDVLEQFCLDTLGEGGGPPLLRLVPPSYLGKTYSK